MQPWNEQQLAGPFIALKVFLKDTAPAFSRLNSSSILRELASHASFAIASSGMVWRFPTNTTPREGVCGRTTGVFGRLY